VTIGIELGLADGFRVGVSVGVEVGFCDGFEVGVCVGVAVGLCDGFEVGVCVGVAVGFCDGFEVGVSVGVAVGLLVALQTHFGSFAVVLFLMFPLLKVNASQEITIWALFYDKRLTLFTWSFPCLPLSILKAGSGF